MNICIVGPRKSKATLKIKLEAEKRDHLCRRIQMIDIYFELVNNEFFVNHRKINLLDFDIFIFRKINSQEKNEAITFAKYLKSKNKIVIDDCLGECFLNDYEIINKLSEEGIPQLNIIRTSGLKTARDILMEFPHPILIKPLDESKERYSISEDWTDSFDIVRTEKSKRFEFQELIEADFYIKVFVIGDKIVGSLKKNILDNDLRLNFAPKTKSQKYEVTEEIKDLVLKTTKVLNYEIASIDLVFRNKKPIIIGIERSPKYQIFNRIFDEKFEKLIVDFLENKK